MHSRQATPKIAHNTIRDVFPIVQPHSDYIPKPKQNVRNRHVMSSYCM